MLPPSPRRAPTEFLFAPFRLDLRSERLFHGDRHLPLRPKAYAVLKHLIDRRGQLVTTDEIFDAVWPDVVVSDGVLRVCVREIRAALGDASGAPRFIETAHRRGYRFIAEVREAALSSGAEGRLAPKAPQLAGRSRELERMQLRLGRAIGGIRVVVFVTGEPGIGKTALVESVIGVAASHPGLLVGRGQCIEQYGACEPYLPVLEALTQLCTGAGGARVVQALARHAPTWLGQMPAFAADQGSVHSGPASPLRMLREMADAMEAIAAESPLLVVLEDVHWSDASTIDLLAYLARRRDPARLLLVATYRPSEASTGAHSLRGTVQELLAHGTCDEERLSLLDHAAVGEYLALRFPGHEVRPDLMATLHRHTGGNPLFLASLVDYLLERGVIVATPAPDAALMLGADEFPVPATARGVIDRQIDLLTDDERGLLEVASVCGLQFTVAELAAAVARGEAEAEAVLSRLARHQRFVEQSAATELANGALTASFGFVHAVHQHALYERVPVARRTELHRRVGAWLETCAGGAAGDLAPALAMHFERGRDYARAVKYCRLAAELAQQRCATDNAIRLAEHGLELLEKAWSEGPERDREELGLRLAQGAPLLAARGYGAAAVEQTYRRALDLSERVGDSALTFPARAGLYAFYLVRADLAIARPLSRQLLEQARADGSPEMLLFAHWTGLVTALNEGRFAAARDHFDEASQLFGQEDARTYLTRFGQDAQVGCRAFGAWALWSLGDASRAFAELAAAHTRAAAVGHPHSLCFAHFFDAFVSQMDRQPARALAAARATERLGLEQGFPQWAAFGAILAGWAAASTGDAEGGKARIEQGLEAYRRTGAAISRPHFLGLLAEAEVAAGRPGQALVHVHDAIVEARRTGGRYYESELVRLEAQIRLAARAEDDESTVRARLREAAAIARSQQALVFERRALDDLAAARRQRSSGRPSPAR